MVLEDRSSCTENSNIVHVPTPIVPTAYLLTVSGVQAKVPALILSEADKATTLLLAARWQVALLDTPPTDGLAWATYESLLSRVDHESNQGYRQLTQEKQPWQIDT